MNEELRRAFIDETQETLTALNNELIELESNPNDSAVIDAIFRRAHTLKGNLGAMSFGDAAALAHAMEDLLDGIRSGEIHTSPTVMDALFAAVDGLEEVTHAVETGNERDIELDGLEAAIRVQLKDAEESEVIEPTNPGGEGDVVVELNPGDLPGADAALVLERLDTVVDDYETTPSRDELLAGEYDDVMTIDTPTPAVVADALEGMRVVDDISTTDTQEASPADESTVGFTGPDEIRSIRVDVDRLDALHGLVETLVTAKIAIDRGIEEGNMDTATEGLNTVEKALSELQDEVMDLRLVPLETVFSSLPRLVRDLSRDTGKDVELAIDGADVELDRTIVNRLDDPLVHLIRNAVDHGIEPPDERSSVGKPPTGKVSVDARRERDTVVLVIADDGKGLDPEMIRERAVEREVRSREELERMEDEAVFDLIFEPGFSTAEEVTDVSGRGVGMDAVRSVITDLDGSISVESDLGSGTSITLRLPVEVAIDDILFVTVDGRTVGVPVRAVAEIDVVDSIQTLHGEPVVDPGDGYIPVIDLGQALATTTTDGGWDTTQGAMLVRIRPDERDVALACDTVLEQEEVVIRPLTGILSDTPGLSGTTVLGQGNVVPILDLQTL